MRQPAAAGGIQPRVLLVIGQLDIGGTERHVAQVAPALRARGVDLSVFALKPGGALLGVLAAAGVPVLVHETRRAGARGLVQAAWRLRCVARAMRPDIVHFFLPAAYLVGACATAFMSARGVMSRRSLACYQQRYPGVRWLERRLHRRMAAVLANSRAVARELRDEGVPPSRLGVIYNGVADRTAGHRRETARTALGIGPQALVLVTIANLIPYKGHADLLDALAQARDAMPVDWCLLLVGRDDGIGPALRAQATRLGIAEHVVWCGAVDDVGQYLAAADIGVLVSHEEGFSNAVLEGMAAGLPMIVSEVGGNAEAVIDGVCGRVVPARDPVALASALSELATSSARRERWGQAARTRALRHFTVETCVERYHALYSNVLAGMSSPIPLAATLHADRDD